jgi:hypothetical protein
MSNVKFTVLISVKGDIINDAGNFHLLLPIDLIYSVAITYGYFLQLPWIFFPGIFFPPCNIGIFLSILQDIFSGEVFNEYQSDGARCKVAIE